MTGAKNTDGYELALSTDRFTKCGGTLCPHYRDMKTRLEGQTTKKDRDGFFLLMRMFTSRIDDEVLRRDMMTALAEMELIYAA